MVRHMTLLAGLSLGAIAFSAPLPVFADDAAQRAGEKIDNAGEKIKDKVGNIDVKTEDNAGLTPGQLPAGVQKSGKDDSEDIRSALAKTDEKVFDKKSLHELIENFVDADRNRLDAWAKDHQDDQAYANLVNRIWGDFKAKYGQDFDVKHEVVFGPEFKGLQIVQGEIVNPTLLSDWPVANKGEAKNAVEEGRQNQANVKGNRPGDRNLDKGRNVAVVSFPASHGLPELNVSMIHELPDRWRLDIPDSIDGQKLHDNLVKHLTEFEQMKDQWPADANEGYRLFTHHVLMALYDVNAPSGQNAGTK